ncbi:AbrB family transcriptional regulator [Bifidobacterium sp. ESL0784]|uniref:AbrB family transcriptional regulator n=1 Tax=Bifidobacterium sp. ESL0784 TaxID=2983231 RepID=UPI0023F9106D|nr:AbrB family transcriptional regulator [Bifidobacterium sp. ESL0784]MDF7640430.1 AbrB family transcriptional regulator [Bifidobacterium sp. ESL0784]
MSETEQDKTNQNQEAMPVDAAAGDAAKAEVSDTALSEGRANGDGSSVPGAAATSDDSGKADLGSGNGLANDSGSGADRGPANDAGDNTGNDSASDSKGSTDSGNDGETGDTDFEPLTNTYEELRHTEDSEELSAAARKPLPPKSDQAAFSRATALLEAVAGNQHTPLQDRIFLAETMPFPNILVKLSEDGNDDVRKAVAANTADKNWLVGRLTKDKVVEVREAALRNPQTSWKMRLEGAQNPDTTADTLDFLSRLGVESEPDAPSILSAMVRRAVALNPNCSQATLTRLAEDASTDVQHAAANRLR